MFGVRSLIWRAWKRSSIYCIGGFAALPKEEASLTVLHALYPTALLPKSKRVDVLRRRFAEAALFLRNDYAALPSVYQRKVETTLIKLQIAIQSRTRSTAIMEMQSIQLFATSLPTTWPPSQKSGRNTVLGRAGP